MSTVERTSTKESTVKQILDLAAFVASVLSGLSFEQVQYWLGHKTLLRDKLSKAFEVTVQTYHEIREEWQKFYFDHFDITIDFSLVQIPQMPAEGSWRLVLIPVGLRLNSTVAAMRKKITVALYSYGEDLDTAIPTNTRMTAQSYAIWVRDGMEPDEKYLGKSTRQADMDGKIGETLLERLIHGFKVFVESDKHLDYKGVTLCTGSRHSDGSVPFVYWDPGYSQVEVDGYDVGGSNPQFGLRQAVSL